jgi:hypothetical protein
MTGINIAGLGAGCGNTLTGFTMGGLGAGAPVIKGITIGGLGVGGEEITGITVAIGMIRIEETGSHTGFATSAFNYIRGKQTGLSIAIFNFAYQLKGIQIGVLNYVRDNPKYLRYLPLINAHF